MHPRSPVALLSFAFVVAACTGAGGGPPRFAGSTSAAVMAPSSAVSAPVSSQIPSSSGVLSPVDPTDQVLVSMSDAMRFAPDPIIVRAGEPITFVVTNAGLIVHEFVVGTEAVQADHAAEMAMGEMVHGHDNALSVDPGETGSLTVIFARSGSILVGCHEPGHYEAGMKATLTVVE